MTEEKQILESDIVEFEDGSLYVVDMLLEVDQKRYAILVPVTETEHEHGDDCECEDEVGYEYVEDADAYIGRIEKDENDEEFVVDPEEDEYERVVQAYEELLEDVEDEE